jgi:hypothetical protein
MAGLGGVGVAMPGVTAAPLVGGAAVAPGNPIIQFLTVADRAQFGYLTDFLWATCYKNAGANAESKMLVPLANPERVRVRVVSYKL